MKTVLHIDNNPIELTMADFDSEIDVDDITSINYSNLFGEYVTISTLMNRIGILKARAEAIYAEKKLEFDIYEATQRKRLRREAAMNSNYFKIEDQQIKLTENSLEEAIIIDEGWQVNKKNVIKAQETLNKIDSIYWAISSKSKKLEVLLKPVTPEEFFDEIIEGKVNGILIKKKKSITKM